MASNPWRACRRDALGDDREPLAAATRPANGRQRARFGHPVLIRIRGGFREASIAAPLFRGFRLRADGTPVFLMMARTNGTPGLDRIRDIVRTLSNLEYRG